MQQRLEVRASVPGEDWNERLAEHRKARFLQSLCKKLPGRKFKGFYIEF